MSLLGIDVGTTGCKAIAFNEKGQPLSQAYREYPLCHPQPGFMELDASLVWEKTQEAIREAASGTASDPIRALAVSSLGEGVLGVSKQGQPLAGAILGFDPRGQEQVERLRCRLGEERIMSLTGMPLASGYTLPKLMWWKDHEPRFFEQAERFLCFQDFVAYKLGAEPAMDLSLAGRTLALDVTRGDWCNEMLEAAGLQRERLSRPVPSGTLIGEVPQGLARELGLPCGVLIAAGGHDQPAGCLGCGAVQSGMAMDATGTVECIAVVLDQPVLSESMRKNSFCCYRHVVPNRFLTLAFNWTGGSILKWFRDILGTEELRMAKEQGQDVYDLLLALMPAEPTSLMLLPYFGMSGTPHFDAESRGIWMGLTLETNKGELVKSLLEGVSMEMRFNLDLLEKAGVFVSSLRAIGGGAKSKAWLQLKADVFDRPVQSLDVSEAACLGMSIMAGVGAGVYMDPMEGVQASIRCTGETLPNPANASIYSQRRKAYSELYQTTRPLIQALNESTSAEGRTE